MTSWPPHAHDGHVATCPQVGHVILFDFPRDGVEYVRRVGRATRGANQPGRVTSLLLGRQVRSDLSGVRAPDKGPLVPRR